ncbi:MAG: ribonuclease Y [marine benthic group bacterium]|nr:ribonuclease Y [Gemmatimonadota bacterium]MCL7984382.1 ribonuclease Y [Gemmatimonadota bacterium]
MEPVSALIAAAVGIVLGAGVGVFAGRRMEARQAELTRGTAQAEARGILEAAEREAGTLKRSAELAGKEEGFRLRDEQLRDVEDRRSELEKLEKRVAEREESLEKKLDAMDQRQERVATREEAAMAREKELESARREVEKGHAELAGKLEQLAGMSAADARARLIERIEEEAKADAAQSVREIRERSRREAEREAKKIIAMSIQRMAVDHSSEITVSVVPLPSDDMKGRIIGREGRNIRSFEHATGVDVVVDDTPEAVILSSFDPVRREIARIAMERLVSDGRIHPGRIEEVVEKASEDVRAEMHEAAEQVLYELGIHGLHPQLVEVLGNLRFRTSYGQNQLAHAREVALLAANMASELGLDVEMTKRMGLLHDIGKGLTHTQEGSHVEIGYELCKRHQEPDAVLNAIVAHHGEEPARYAETFLVTAADAISGARPGARRESFEHYVKRLEKLEEIAQSYAGVSKVYAIQAGREIRILVMPEKITDEEMATLSEETARRIEEELQYPGQIKVVVVRETRAVNFAR